MSSPCVSVTTVSKTFPASPPRSISSALGKPAPVIALDHVSFALERGRILGVLGPNGSGKTTLLKIIASLILPDAGTVRVAGFNPLTHDRQVKMRLGMVSADDRALYSRLSGLQNLECFAALYGLSRARAAARIRELMSVFKISYAHRRLDRCSTGMRRTIGLAQALLHDPAVILADEPTRSLDLHTATLVRGRLRELTQRGKTVVLATHNIEEAQELSDEFLILNRGRVCASGTLAQLRAPAGNAPAGLSDIYRNLIDHDA